MTKIRDLRKGDIVRLENGHEVFVESITLDVDWYPDIAKVYSVKIQQEGILYDTDVFEKVTDYTIKEDDIE